MKASGNETTTKLLLKFFDKLSSEALSEPWKEKVLQTAHRIFRLDD